MIVNEKQFLKTMIEYVKYEDFPNKDEILTILRNSIITFEKTSYFTKKVINFGKILLCAYPSLC